MTRRKQGAIRLSGQGRWVDTVMLSKPFLTTHEIAELLKVGEPTVRTWIHNEDLRAVKLGREFRVSVKDLEAFVEERATRAPSWRPPA